MPTPPNGVMRVIQGAIATVLFLASWMFFFMAPISLIIIIPKLLFVGLHGVSQYGPALLMIVISILLFAALGMFNRWLAHGILRLNTLRISVTAILFGGLGAMGMFLVFLFPIPLAQKISMSGYAVLSISSAAAVLSLLILSRRK